MTAEFCSSIIKGPHGGLGACIHICRAGSIKPGALRFHAGCSSGGSAGTGGAKPQKPGALTQLRGAAPPSASVRLRGSTAPLCCRDSACRDAGVGVGGADGGGGGDGWAEVEDFHYKITCLLGIFLLPPLYSNHTGGPLSFVHTLPPFPPTLQEAAKAEHTEEQAH